MRVSFDLDETLFIDPKISEIEKEFGFIWKVLYKERLRKGFLELAAELRKNKIEIWIYTTSFRSIGYIKRYFKKYGIKFDGIVNGAIHQQKVQGNKLEVQPSKYPPRFKIDLHIDDDKSVKANGDTLGFKTLILEQSDRSWTEKVLNLVKREIT